MLLKKIFALLLSIERFNGVLHDQIIILCNVQVFIQHRNVKLPGGSAWVTCDTVHEGI